MISFSSAIIFICKIIKIFLPERKKVSLSGIWSTTFTSYTLKKNNIELYYISQSSDFLKFKIEQYNDMHPDRVKCYKGRGVYIGENISGYYYDKSGETTQTGTLIARITFENSSSSTIVAQYNEFYNSIKKGTSKPFSNKIFLRKINVPFKKRLQMLFSKTAFKNYIDCNEFICSLPLAEAPHIQGPLQPK